MLKQQFTLGIEEEFQLVDRQTGQLCPRIDVLLKKGKAAFGERIKTELVQSAVEITTDVCPDIIYARRELYDQRSLLAHIAEEAGIAIISAGTHPVSPWQEQLITQEKHYLKLIEEQQDAVRVHVIFGLHVHIGMESRTQAIVLMNQLRTWLPHLLALSANSPFWGGRYTGIKSYRSVLWQGGNRSGVPEIIPSLESFDRFVEDLTSIGYIRGSSDIWWDIRLHPIYNTLEFRVCDMPATIEDTVALAALCQALVAKLGWLYVHNVGVPVLPRDYITENKWRALRYGLDGQIADFIGHRSMSMRDSIHELLDFVKDVLDDLGSTCEMNYLRNLLERPEGTGADRQIAVYERTGNVQNVVQYLIDQTMQGIAVGAEMNSMVGSA